MIKIVRESQLLAADVGLVASLNVRLVVPIPERATRPSSDPRWSIMTTDDGSQTLIDNACGDSMHSGCGALAETEHVYLINSGVAAALEQQRPQSVLEIGLGTGLALLATAQLAETCGAAVQYRRLKPSRCQAK